jgi:hypothetical protein
MASVAWRRLSMSFAWRASRSRSGAGASLSRPCTGNHWLEVDDHRERLHYRTPTEPGSSGSSVFDQDSWTLLGLHHAGKEDMPRLHGTGTYQANEGFLLTAIGGPSRPNAGVTGAGSAQISP